MRCSWLLLLVFCCLCVLSTSFPILDSLAVSHHKQQEPITVIHHRHKKHHSHKHRRRSLTSKEDAKTRRNKQVMLAKPYWPWP